jgi:hypothetical protein
MYKRSPRLTAAARQDLFELNGLRLEHDWTFPELAAAMAKAGCPVTRTTLYNSLRPGSTTVPYERTLHKMRRFVEQQRMTAEARLADRAQARAERARRRAAALAVGTGEEA